MRTFLSSHHLRISSLGDVVTIYYHALQLHQFHTIPTITESNMYDTLIMYFSPLSSLVGLWATRRSSSLLSASSVNAPGGPPGYGLVEIVKLAQSTHCRGPKAQPQQLSLHARKQTSVARSWARQFVSAHKSEAPSSRPISIFLPTTHMLDLHRRPGSPRSPRAWGWLCLNLKASSSSPASNLPSVAVQRACRMTLGLSSLHV